MKTYLRTLTNSRLVRNAGWMFAGQGLSVVTQGLYFVALARLLGSAQYGILAGATALVSIVSQYSTLGSGLLFIRYVSADKQRFREYWGNILLSTITLGSLLVLLLYLSAPWLVGSTNASVLIVLAIADCLCGQLAAAASQVFQTFERMHITATLGALTSFLRLLLAAAMLFAMQKATAWEWAISSLAVSILGLGIAVIIVTTQFGLPKFVPRLLLSRAREGFIFALSGSTTSIYNDIDKAMMGHYGMNVANGIYSMAYRVINMAAMPISSIHAAAFPRFFREGVRGFAGTEPLARKLLARTAAIGAGISLALFLVSPALPTFVGRSFEPGISAVRWLCLIPLFRCFHLSAGDALSGAGWQKLRLTAQLAAAIFNFSINLYLIPRYSWLGAAWASLITDAGLGAMNWLAVFWLRSRQTRGQSSNPPTPKSIVDPNVEAALETIVS